jgi:hypothetical protein
MSWTLWGSGGIAPNFLTSTLDGGEWSSRPGRFTTGLNAVKRKNIVSDGTRTPTILFASPYSPSFPMLYNVLKCHVAIFLMVLLCFREWRGSDKSNLPYEIGYVITCVGNVTEENPCVLSEPQRQKNTWGVSNLVSCYDDVAATSFGDEPSFP